MSESKFKGVFDARKKRESAPTLVEVLAGGEKPAELVAKEARAKEILRSADSPAPLDPSYSSARQVKRGKRSDPNFDAIFAYVRKDVCREVKKALIDDERELSELIQELLSRWLDERAK